MAETENMQDRESRIALRSGGAFLFVSAIVRILGMVLLALALAAQGESPTSIVTFKRLLNIAAESVAGFMLWKGHQNWRGTAVFFTAAIFVSALLNTLTRIQARYANSGDILSLLGYLCLIVALCITVSGKPNRRRTWVGIGVFLVGFLGLSIMPAML